MCALWIRANTRYLVNTAQLVKKGREVTSALLKKMNTSMCLFLVGGKGLIEAVSKNASMPVIKHLDGVCHVFVDSSADLSKAYDVVVNSKTNAMVLVTLWKHFW